MDNDRRDFVLRAGAGIIGVASLVTLLAVMIRA